MLINVGMYWIIFGRITIFRLVEIVLVLIVNCVRFDLTAIISFETQLHGQYYCMYQ